MNKAKIFFKVVYYIFMVVVVLLLAIILPRDNQYTLMNDYLKANIANETYNKIPNLFSNYYNKDAVVSKDINDYHVEIYEAATTNAINDSTQYYSNSIYMGFIFNAYNYNYVDLKDANDVTYNNTSLILKNQNLEYKIKLELSLFTYLSKYGMVYFEITEYDLYKSSINEITSIDFYQNDNTRLFGIDSLNLSFSSNFFNQASKYNILFNSGYLNIPLSIQGQLKKEENYTSLAIGSSLSFTTVAQTLINVKSNTLLSVTSNNVILNPNSGTTTYTFPANTNVVITASTATQLSSIEVIYDNALKYVYSFNNDSYETYIKAYSYNDGLTSLGDSYNEQDIKDKYTSWLENYSFTSSSFTQIVSNATPMAIGQVVLIIIAFLIVGDFLVGKRYILSLIKKIIIKFKKNNPNDSLKEVTQAFNDYEVNVECKIITPQNYNNDIHIVYKLQNSNDTMTFDLDFNHQYKSTNRFRNGVYELVEFKADNLELLEPKEVLNVKGYKYVIEQKTALK